MSNGVARSPLYEAHHAPRYERQELIRQYQEAYGCRLVVVADILIPNSLTQVPDAMVEEREQRILARTLSQLLHRTGQ